MKIRLLMVAPLVIPIVGLSTAIAIAATSCSNTPQVTKYEVAYTSNYTEEQGIWTTNPLTITGYLKGQEGSKGYYLYTFYNITRQTYLTNDTGVLSSSEMTLNSLDQIKCLVTFITPNLQDRVVWPNVWTTTWRVI